MPPKSRRTVLGSTVAVLGSVAGCSALDSSDDGDTSPEPSTTASQSGTPTETPDSGDSDLQQRVDELEAELDETKSKLEQTEAELETARQAATAATQQLVADKYVYALSLTDSADQFFEQASEQWQSKEFDAVIETVNRSIGLYLAGQAAAKEAAAQANEEPTRWGGDPSSAANTLFEYGREMEGASSQFVEAAKTAREGKLGQADAIREDVAETVDAADDIDTLSADSFRDEL